MYQTEITLANTSARQLIDTGRRFSQLIIFAKTTNSGVVNVGNATDQTFPVAAGGSLSFEEVDPSEIYIKGTADDVVEILGIV